MEASFSALCFFFSVAMVGCVLLVWFGIVWCNFLLSGVKMNFFIVLSLGWFRVLFFCFGFGFMSVLNITCKGISVSWLVWLFAFNFLVSVCLAC